MELLFVFGRLVLSLASNVYQKKLTEAGLPPFYIAFAIYVVLGLLSLPLIATVQVSNLGRPFWLNISLASLFDVSGWMFLVLSLSKTDLSVFGPLNAYKVVFSLLLAVVFLHELPNAQGLIGVSVIILGSFLLTPSNQQTQLRKIPALLKDKGVQARFLSIALFSVGTIFLKNAAIFGSPLSALIFWSLIGLPLAMLSNHLLLPHSMRTYLNKSKAHIPTILSVGVMVFFMQYFTLVLLREMLIAYALALFQLGMVIQVLIGYRVFNEKDIGRKLLAAVVMMTGSVMVLLA